MSFSFSAYLRLGAVGICAFVAACEGDSGAKLTDGGFERTSQTDAGVVDRPPSIFDSGGGGLAEARPVPPPPALNPSGSKLLEDGWEMLGTHGTGCSHGMPSRAVGGPRWCALSKTGTKLGAREIWVMNVTAAAAAPGTVKCDGTNVSCIKLSEDLFSARPDDGPRYPGSHRFYGETLIYYASPKSGPSELFRGTAFAWIPGWTAAKAISGDNATICSGHSRANVAWCIVNVQGLMEGQTLTWDEHVGDINNGVMPKIASIFPRHPVTEGSQADSLFTLNGDYYVWSTPASGAAIPGSNPPKGPPESLYYVKVSDIKPGAPVVPVKVGDDISNWTVNGDSTKYVFLKEYNYNTSGQPSGSLYIADFPTGANPIKLEGPRIPSGPTNGVAAFRLLLDENNMGTKIGILAEVAAGRGNYRIINNPANVNDVVNVVSGTLGLPLPSPNLQYSYYATRRAMDIATTDSMVTPNDGSRPGCALTNSDSSALFGFPFTKNGALSFWMDNYDQATDSGQGWVANTADCSARKMYTTNIDYWFVYNDEALLYSDEGDGQTAALKYSPITANAVGAPITIQKQINRTFWILPNYEGVLYSITSTQPAANGIYYLKLPPSGSPPAASDAGAPADAAPDTAAGN